ncbi:MAG: YncE family protein [Bacteroidota bacterium]|nr:YncE family protein [Bacteroidota bacterium]
MKNNFLLILFISMYSFTSCKSQSTYGEKYLQLNKTIVLPNVKGRIDHIDVNVKEKIVYVAALGNNTLEVVDLMNGKVIHSIHGLDEPQGVGYIPQTNEIFVANGGSGDCYFYSASTFAKTAAIHLSSDADDVRYDSASHSIYVGYGEGGIAIIDANTHKQTGDVKLSSHPEGFQIDNKANIILVNVPDKNMIGIIDLAQLKLTNSWKRNSPSANFPMAIDAQNNYAFIGYRHPAKLVVLDIKTGKEINSNNMVSDVDDLYFDKEKKRIYISGGGGYINIFQRNALNTFKQITNMPTRSGARTSLFIPQLQLFVLAERAEYGNPARLLIYHTSLIHS